MKLTLELYLGTRVENIVQELNKVQEKIEKNCEKRYYWKGRQGPVG